MSATGSRFTEVRIMYLSSEGIVIILIDVLYLFIKLPKN